MLYMDLYQEIKNRILDGRLSPGEKLPSKRQLSKDRGVSINTVEKALGQLEVEGYVQAIERSGVYVLKQKLTSREPNSWDYVEKEVRKPRIDWRYKGVDKDFPYATWRRLSSQVIDQYSSSLTESGPRQGEKKLREAISTYLWTSRGLDVPSSHIVVDSSTESLLLTILRMLEKPTIGVEDPGFQRWGAFLKSNLIERIPIEIDKDGAKPSSKDKDRMDALFLTPSYQFPTGQVMSIGRKQEILDWADEKEKWILEDDYNGEFRFEGSPIPPLKSVDDKNRVIYIGSFSTTVSPALRVSFMVLPDQLMRKFSTETYYFSCSVPRLTQLVLAEFMTSGSYTRHINRMRRKYSRKRNLLTQWVKARKDLRVIGSNGGLHLLLEYKKDGLSEEDLLALAKEKDMALSPLSNYEITKKSRNPMFVIGYGKSSEKELKEGMKILDQIWSLQ